MKKALYITPRINYLKIIINIKVIADFLCVRHKLYKSNLNVFLCRSELRKVPSFVSSFTAKRQYLHATKTLTNAIALGAGPLREVEGLNDLRKDLELKKQQLDNRLHEELNKYLYLMPTQEFLSEFNRQGSARNSNFGPSAASSPFQRNVLRKSAERAESNSKVRKALFEMSQGQGQFDMDKTEILDENEIVDTELNQTYFFGIIVECFALLDKVPESLETVQVQIQSEIGAIITRTTQHILSTQQQPQNADVTKDENHHPLLELLDILFKELKIVADSHVLLLKSYTNVIQRYTLSAKTYDVTDFWTHAQTVLQNLLIDYLDIQNSGDEEQSRSNGFTADQTNNLSTFFSRRKAQK